jgi:hypothetical protein
VELSDADIGTFDAKVLRLDPEKRKTYLEQVDHLIQRLEAKINEDTSFGVKKFLRAGSLWKGTALQPRDGRGVDADIAVYLEADEATQFDLATLHEQLRRLAMAIYPQKSPDDFEVHPRTLGIHFHDSGLDIDLVPVVPIAGLGDYGWQPSSQGDPPVKTSIPGQLEFVRRRAEADPRYRPLVRLLKGWRDYHELDPLRSFAIDLLVAHLQERQGTAQRLEEGLLRFFLWVAQTELREPVAFQEIGPTGGYTPDPVVVLDPVNAENNVTRRITDPERAEIVRVAAETWEIITTARRNGYKGETLEYWRQALGRSFTIEE